MELQREELEKLYSDTFRGLHSGAILKGKVLQMKQDGAIVDVGTKCEGFIPTSELPEEERKNLKRGDEIEVFVMDLRDPDGFVSLSRERALKIKTWEILEDACNTGVCIDGKITGKVKGGMTVEISGITAFLPGSHVDIKNIKDVDYLVGMVCPFKVITINNKRSNIIVSRRAVLEEQREIMKKQTLSNIKEGAIVTGVVKNLTDYGAFIDLGGLDGLLHISDMSWGKISHPGELFSIGDSIEVKVLSYSQENEKVTLGYKQKKPDPWIDAEKRYPPSKKILGKVTNIVEYGIFIELEEGLDGLVHVSEFDWLEKVKRPSKYFSIGDTVEAVVLNVNSASKRISLSIKQLKSNPWETINEKYSIGQRVSGIVKSLSDFGAFIILDDGVDALLHISEMSWTKHIKHPSEMLKKGQNIEVVIMNIDPEKERISVGLKALTEDPWIGIIPNKYKVGDQIKGKITKIADFGMFIELEGGVEGLIYSSEIEKPADKTLDEVYKPGMELTASIIKLDAAEKKIGLSMKTTGNTEP
ncbi:MAG: 30S ribosomal protein S1 [Nitrospirae bacterium]|nr:30S ribosomal protein S1 [Nitrospirota bacterium]